MTDLPPVLAGPLLRRVEARRVVLWLATREAPRGTLLLAWNGERREFDLETCARRLRIGQHAWINLLDVDPGSDLPADTPIDYDLHLALDGATRGIADWAPHLLYPGQTRPCFVRRAALNDVLHGSCRKPHFDGPDGLLQVDALLAQRQDDPSQRPALLMLSGDQVYADDVAGPMLAAIHRLIERLGLYDETLDGACVADSQALYASADSYYRREALLPAIRSNEPLRERFFGGVEKPVFTSSSAHNHLVSLAEVLAMYLLVWSPQPWRLVELQPPPLPADCSARYAAERPRIEAFAAGLPGVARALAQLPTLMIFDDHDVTDDWNLSARWEETAYGHPFSRRIVGNALLGYALCQGWGNDPDACAPAIDACAELLDATEQDRLPRATHDRCIDTLLAFQHWHYQLPGTPTLIVLDTRTRRWRSERHPSRPSGLMDWEALCELQQALLDQRAAIIVSPAPIFGVKLIEAVQRVFSWAGHALLVDAENWMAHRGAARVILNIFRHSRTPGNYVILSGDVHYSFAYEVRIRQRRGAPQLWQVTSSGIKNEFPRRLLDGFDRLNRWLYAPWSPLNLFTQRRRMQVQPRIPSRAQRGERLWNGAGIGEVRLDEDGRPTQILQHNADGSGATDFDHCDREHWH